MIPTYEPDVRHLRYAWAVACQVLSGWVGPGRAVAEFERLLCEATGRKYCVATSSGTTAIMAALWAVGHRAIAASCKPALFPDYTCLSGAHAALAMGCPVQLVDIERNSLCMNDSWEPQDAAAVIYVDHNGHLPHGAWATQEKCRNHGVPLIEDACQALGCPTAGAVGDVAAFSFSALKLVTTGQGGAVVTDRESLYERLRAAVDHGAGDWRKTHIHPTDGLNLRMSDVSAALGIAQLRRLDTLVARRRKIRSWYDLPGTVVPLDGWHVLYRTENAVDLMVYLSRHGVQASQYYRPVHHNPAFAGPTGNLHPEAERAAKELLYLPSSLTLRRRDVRRICELIWRRDVAKHRG